MVILCCRCEPLDWEKGELWSGAAEGGDSDSSGGPFVLGLDKGPKLGL